MGDVLSLNPYLLKLFETMADGVILVDSVDRIVQINPALERMLGVSRHALEGQLFHQAPLHIVREDGSSLEASELATLVDNVMRNPIERLLLGMAPLEAPEAIRWVEVSISAIRGEREEDFIGAMSVLRDVTSSRQALEALHMGEARWRNLFDTMAEGVLLFNPQGRIERVNPAALRIIGAPARFLIQSSVFTTPLRFIDADGQPLPPDHMANVFREAFNGPITGLVMGAHNRVGDTVWVELAMAPIVAEPGEPPAWIVCVMHEITAQRQAEAALRQRGAGLEQMVAERTADLERINDQLQAEMEGRQQVEAQMRRYLSLLRATLEGSADGVLVRDLEGNPVLHNRSFRDIFGRRPTRIRPDDLEFDNLPLWQDYADVEEARQQMRYVLDDPARIRRDILRLKDGRLIERNVRPQWLRGEIIGRVSTYRDVTAQHRLEAALRERTNYLQTVIDTSPTNIFIRDLESRYQMVNRTMAQTYGLPAEAFIGRATVEMADMIGVDPAESAAYVDADRQVIETGKVRITEGPFTRIGHETRWYETIKVPLREDGRIIGILGVATDRTEQRRTVAALQESEARYRGLVENAPVGIMTIDRDGKVTDINAQALRIFGAPSVEAALGLNLLQPDARVRPAIQHEIEQVLRSGEPLHNERPLKTIWEERQGFMRYHLAPMRDSAGQVMGVQALIEDVTEYRQLQEQLRQAAKLQAIGQLAGGVAHNFNNLLTVINGYAELALSGLTVDDPLQSDLTQIYQAGKQAADLTRQLLAFSRRQVAEVTVFDLNAAVKGLAGMLHGLIGEEIRSQYELLPRELPIRADRAAVEQMVINLCLNARDAMPDGGVITVRTRAIMLQSGAMPHYLEVAPGLYAVLEVRDTGQGMSAEVQERLFEPFFTTKPVDRGTGLGLSTLYGTMQELGGGIDVVSAPGEGALFRLYIPMASLGEKPPPSTDAHDLPRGRERILVVEDQQEVREAAALMLRRLGYQVTSADGPTEALRLCHSQLEPFDLIIMDVVMPTMTGPELARALPGMCQQAVVLLMSGYTGEALEAHGVPGDLPVLGKPFSIAQLARAVRQALGPAIGREQWEDT